MNDVATHQHGKTKHRHAWASISHSHVLRAVCSRPECADYDTHNIHPDKQDQHARARVRAGEEGVGF